MNSTAKSVMTAMPGGQSGGTKGSGVKPPGPPPGPPGRMPGGGPGRCSSSVRPSSSFSEITGRTGRSAWRRRNESDVPMRWPFSSSSASGRRSRCDQSRSAIACASGDASAPGSERCSSSAQAATRSFTAPSTRTRSCSMWRWNSQPDTAANSSSTTTMVM